MSNDEVRALTANPVASKALLSWFSKHGIVVDWVNRGQEYFRVRSTVSQWERLLRTTFHEFHEEMYGTHVRALRAESYSLPASIAIHVESVFGAVDFPVMIQKSRRESSDFDTWMNQKHAMLSETETKQTAMHTKAVNMAAKAVTWVQLNQFPTSSCTPGSAFSSFNFAVGYCVPKTIALGVNAILLNATGSAVFLNTFSDSFCQSPVGSPQPLPSDSTCIPFNGEFSTFIMTNGTDPEASPISPFNNVNVIK
jgi:hypothetical protein